MIERIKELMSEMQIKNLRQLSLMSGIPYSTLDSMFNDDCSKTKLPTLNKLKVTLNTTLDYLIYGTGEKHILSEEEMENQRALKEMYFHLGKEAQELGLSQTDINLMLDFFRQHKKNNQNLD